MINQGRTDTRWRIIAAAMHLFWAKGYGSTSIADILSRAGVNSGSLYHSCSAVSGTRRRCS